MQLRLKIIKKFVWIRLCIRLNCTDWNNFDFFVFNSLVKGCLMNEQKWTDVIDLIHVAWTFKGGGEGWTFSCNYLL